MNSLGLIACGTGLRDGLNPCIFMACAVLILQVLWLKGGSLRTGLIFGLVYAASGLVFNFGPAQIFLFNKYFIFTAKVLYFVLGVGAFIIGIVFLKDWFLLRRGLTTCHCEGPAGQRSNLFRGPAALLTIIMLGLVLSALSTLWPIDNYIMLLGNETLLKGEWPLVVPLLLGYVFASMWPLWFVWAFISIRGLRPSLFKMGCAAIFFTASSCMMFIFFKN